MRLKLPPYWQMLVTPTALWCLGLSMNILAITANHGAMPWALTMKQAIEVASLGVPSGALAPDGIHKIMIGGDHLKFICDWVQIPGLGTSSPGDLFLWLGEYLRAPMFVSWLTTLALRTKKID